MNLIKKTIREAMKTPGFSLLYMAGVAFTVAFTIIYGMLLYSQLGPVYPEYDRSRTMYVKTLVNTNENNRSSGFLGRNFIEEFLRDKLKSADSMTAIIINNWHYPMVQTNGQGPEFHAEVRYVEPSFFRFYRYEFKEGKPFSEEEFESEIRVADISEGIANRLFGSPEEAIGKDISIDHVDYRIRGVFREGSALNVDSYGEIFLPYTLVDNGKYELPPQQKYSGGLQAVIKVKPGKEREFRDELRDITRRINAIDTTGWKFHLPGVMTHAEHVLTDTSVDFSWDGDEAEIFKIKESTPLYAMWKPFLIALLVVLVIPALNISGLIGARMDRMASELGIRRSFGANRRRLMGMVLTENLVLTLAGGILGLIAAWLISVFAGNFLLQLTPLAYETGFSFGNDASFITGETAFAPLLFLFALVICLILNLISAWIPARRALHNQITESLNTKR
ncbi:MAG: ABC transporter permease [Muribaculaceae bacterium]|nr:ABC transporter permease [Muribaculaceae bacterium]MDE6553163.1 ABC transporter permease [Muribaculaceae bacterium]